MNWLEYLFQQFTPHGHCYAWTPDIHWMNALGDLGIFIAYVLIPIALMKIFYRYKEILKTFGTTLILFSAFLFACGITHLIDFLTIWLPSLYRVQGYERVFTAGVSLMTATVLWARKARGVKINAYTAQISATESAQITEISLPQVVFKHLNKPLK